MASPDRKKFMVLYLVPASVMDDWSKTDPAQRKEAEDRLRGEWVAWMGVNAKMFVATEAAGKTKRITPSGVADARNDLMLYSIVEAESHDAAAKAFENHPHLQIPESSIEVMEIRPMGPM